MSGYRTDALVGQSQALIQQQFAAVGAATTAALPDVLAVLRQMQARGIAVEDLLEKYTSGQEKSRRFVEAYRRYCWSVNSLDDYRLAPFHILATEGQVHVNKNHGWHLETIREFCLADPQWLMATSYRVVQLSNADEFRSAVEWWLEKTAQGGEGMVIKPFEFMGRGKKGLIQPALKCRGKEYLRLIYGPEYDAPENLQRLKVRGLGAKRSLAIREFALGMEGLERFVAKEPLRHVHECVFGVLALESEPVDPQL